MEKRRILYTDTDGTITFLIPSENCLLEHTIQEIAEKDVPHGRPYKIITTDDLPDDLTFMGAWEVNESDLNDGVGGEHHMFLSDPQHPDYSPPEET